MYKERLSGCRSQAGLGFHSSDKRLEIATGKLEIEAETRLLQHIVTAWDTAHPDAPLNVPGLPGPVSGLKVTVFLEVEGAAHHLPAYAGNLDIMTAAALKAGERLAELWARKAS